MGPGGDLRCRPARACRSLLLGAGLVLLALAGCRPATKEAADREAYRALAVRRAYVPEVAGSLDLERSECTAIAARAQARSASVRRLSLAEALDLATRASREARSRREDVFLTALALSDQRHAFRSIPFAGGAGELARDDVQTTGSASLEAGVSRALESGGSVALAIATDVLKNLTGAPLHTAQSLLSLDVLLPLARGSGRRIARENLTQAERDVIYALRTYARFQQELTLDVATSFYRALQARDTWANEERTFASLSRLERQQGEMGPEGAGRTPGFQVDQARQDTLRADDRRQRAKSAYERSVDELRLLLGLPLDAPVEPDDADLAQLAGRGTRAAGLTLEQALAEVRCARLDLANAREQVEDARRKAEVARDGMGPQVDLALGADLTTPSTQPLNLSEASRRFAAGLVVDLPLDRTPERNAFRVALIQAVRAWRALEGLEDAIARDVRADLRDLEETRRSHAILTDGVRLAERRVDLTSTLFTGPGGVAVRDVLEAEDDLLQARNDLTRALVDHALAWLRLELDLGRLRVDGSSAPPRSCVPPPPPPPPVVCPPGKPCGFPPPSPAVVPAGPK